MIKIQKLLNYYKINNNKFNKIMNNYNNKLNHKKIYKMKIFHYKMK